MSDGNENKDNIIIRNKENNDKNEKKGMSDQMVILLVLFITMIGMLAFSLSVSIFNGSLPIKDNAINHIIAGKHHDDKDEGKVVFSYYEKPGIGNGIQLEDQFPISDAEGRALRGDKSVFEFKLLLNEKSVGVRYTIVVEKLVNSDLRNDLVKLYLESNGKEISNVVRENGSIKSFTEYNDYRKRATQKVLCTGTITRAEANRGYKDFAFKMWLSDELPLDENDYGRKFLTRINVYASGDL